MLFGLAAVMLGFGSCTKNSNTPEESGIQWMRVLQEDVSGNTETDAYMGQNGQVLTDAEGFIYLYYYDEYAREAVVVKCDPAGSSLWKKTFPDCIPMDMVRMSDGDLVLAVRDLPGYSKIMMLYVIHPDETVDAHPVVQTSSGGSDGMVNVNMCALPDNSLVMSGVYLQLLWVGSPLKHEGFALKLDASFVKEWDFLISFSKIVDQSYSQYEQNSVLPVSGGKYLLEFSVKADRTQSDSISYGFLTAVYNPSIGDVDAFYFRQTGYEVQSTGVQMGYYNRYAGKMIAVPDGGVLHYSGPVALSTSLAAPVSLPGGLLFIGSDAVIRDTVPLPVPEGYRVTACSGNEEACLATAYRIGAVNINGDFSANQTLFLAGTGWQPNRTFTLQQFYSDFFPSVTALSGGGFLVMGKIQSLNGPKNKLILLKWKDNG